MSVKIDNVMDDYIPNLIHPDLVYKGFGVRLDGRRLLSCQNVEQDPSNHKLSTVRKFAGLKSYVWSSLSER